MRVIIDDVEISTNDENATKEELLTYFSEIQKRQKGKKITKMIFTVDGDYLNVEYHFVPQRFERIRRITGYLVGTVDRWNNGKRSEERDRVKHGLDGAERI